MVVRGSNKGREGKVTSVYRLKYCIHVNGSMYAYHSPILGTHQSCSRPREVQRPIRPHPPRPIKGRRHQAQARQGPRVDPGAQECRS